MKNYRIGDLLDMAIVQKLAEANWLATGMPIGIVDAVDGSILVAAGWQEICTRFHRIHPISHERCRESDNYIKSRLVAGEACQYKCKNGLWDIGIPIVIGESHLATLFIGQFFYEGEMPERELFIRQAGEFGYDLNGYLAALDQVPVFSREKVDNIVAYDITLARFIADLAVISLDKIMTEEQLRASLSEKEILLKEIHHRVKNNLQVICTLLELQSDYIVDDRSRKYFMESQDRIRSMALVHEKLYQVKDFSCIDFTGYINSLTNYLYRSYVTDPERVSLTTDVGNVTLGIDEAIPCGLIINELVSNSLKYALPDGRKGDITVRFQADNQGLITLTVADNGAGFPAGLNFRETDSLGLQLVNMLTTQLRGDIDLRTDKGTEFTIHFKK